MMSNKKPTVYTTVFWLIQEHKIEPEALFDFQELFWPSFIEIDNYVFLKENFSEEKYKKCNQQETDPEYWINLLTIDEYFSELSDWREKSISFAKSLVSIWNAKLKQEFPKKKFSVQFVHSDDVGDYGLTFFSVI